MASAAQRRTPLCYKADSELLHSDRLDKEDTPDASSSHQGWRLRELGVTNAEAEEIDRALAVPHRGTLSPAGIRGGGTSAPREPKLAQSGMARMGEKPPRSATTTSPERRPGEVLGMARWNCGECPQRSPHAPSQLALRGDEFTAADRGHEGVPYEGSSFSAAQPPHVGATRAWTGCRRY